jgi:hypothetical protein
MRNINIYIVIAGLLVLGSCKALMSYTNILLFSTLFGIATENRR